MNRRLLALAALLVSGLAHADVIENASVVTSTDGTQVSEGAMAFGFVAASSHDVEVIAVYVESLTTGGNQRTWRAGLKAANASQRPTGEFLGGPTNWVRIPTGGYPGFAEVTLPAAVPLTAGTPYFVVVEYYGTGHNGNLTLRSSSPEVDREALTQAPNDRTVLREIAGVWTEVPLAEPIFVLGFTDPDLWAPTCTLPKATEGNPYYQALGAVVDPGHPAMQSFFTPASGVRVTGVEVPLSLTLTMPEWDLYCGAGPVLASGTLSNSGAPGPGTTLWYSSPVWLTSLPGNALCTLRLRMPGASGSVTWPGSRADSTAGTCDAVARAGFHGGEAYLSGQASSGTLTSRAADAVFRVQTCVTDCPDAGAPGLDAGGLDAAEPGLDAAEPGLDAAAPGRDASAPGRDASAPGRDASAPGRDASAPGQDASAPGEDAASLPDDAALVPDDAALPTEDAALVPDDAAALVADGSALVPDAEEPTPPDASTSDSGTEVDSGATVDDPAGTSVYGCQCNSAAGLMPLGLLAFALRPLRRRRSD